MAEKKCLSGVLRDRQGLLVEYSAEYLVLPGRAGAFGEQIARRQAAAAFRLVGPARRQRHLEGPAFQPYRAQGTVSRTYDRDGLYGCTGDWLVWAGLRGSSQSRWAAILDRQGRPMPVERLFRGLPPENAALEVILPQAAELARDGCTLYADWRRALRAGFSWRRSYLTEAGFACWYPRCCLGPASTGLPTFLLPYTAVESWLKRPL